MTDQRRTSETKPQILPDILAALIPCSRVIPACLIFFMRSVLPDSNHFPSCSLFLTHLQNKLRVSSYFPSVHSGFFPLSIHPFAVSRRRIFRGHVILHHLHMLPPEDQYVQASSAEELPVRPHINHGEIFLRTKKSISFPLTRLHTRGGAHRQAGRHRQAKNFTFRLFQQDFLPFHIAHTFLFLRLC